MNWKALLFGNSREELLNFMVNVKCKLCSLHVFEWPLGSLICVFLTAFLMDKQALSYIRVDGNSFALTVRSFYWTALWYMRQYCCLDCWLLSYIHFESGNFTIFSLNGKTVWLKYSICVWQSTAVALCQFPHQLLVKGGAAAQRSHDLPQEGEERYNDVFCSTLLCQLMGCALHVIDCIMI